MLNQKQKGPQVLADLASQRKNTLNSIIAQGLIYDTLFDADMAMTSETCADLRGYFQLEDFAEVV